MMRDTEDLTELQSYNPAGNTAQKINYMLITTLQEYSRCNAIEGKEGKT